MTAVQRCRSLELPAELRVQIYEYTFEGCEIIVRADTKGRIVKPPAPALLKVNKQIYNEAVDISYASVTITCAMVNKISFWQIGPLLPSSRWSDIKHVTLVCASPCWREDEEVAHAEFHHGLHGCMIDHLEYLGAKKAAVGLERRKTPNASSEVDGEE